MDITTDQLRQMIHLKERIEFLEKLLQRIRGAAPTKPKRKVGRPAGKRTKPSDRRAKIAAAMKARWAAKKKGGSALNAAKS